MQITVCALLLVSLVGSALTYTIPEPEVQLLEPRGVRISIPHENGIVLVAFHVNINKPIALNQPGEYSADIMKPTNGRWTFDNTQAFVDADNEVNYWIHVQHGSYGYRKLGTATPQSSGTPVVTPRTDPTNCEPSITTVQRRATCKGELIFEDNFNSLDSTKWKHEIRIPAEEEDSEFVSFQGRPENCYVSNGELHVVSSMLYELPGFNESMIRLGSLDLGPRCTAKVDVTSGCKRTAQWSQVLPPVVSARIQTKDSFSFRFGKVEVRAKLPKGDWLFPLILLEPLENYYGYTRYASGQMRVAFNRGNEVLKDRGGVDISGRRLSGGIVLSSDEPLRRTGLKESLQTEHLGDDFHTFTLIWTNKAIALQVDGIDYASIEGPFVDDYYKAGVQHAKLWENGNPMAPFDKEFFLTLGLSAGGHADFPEDCVNGPERRKKPWRNLDPKAELKFWNDRTNWLPTWDEGLIVDYVKVYAL